MSLSSVPATAKVHETVAVVTCPRCAQSKMVRRSHRRGIDHMLSLFKLYPYRCQSCLHRFRRFGARVLPAHHD